MQTVDTRPVVRLDVVEIKPHWKTIACGWGTMIREGKLFAVKILIKKSRVEALQQQLAAGERPEVKVGRWQIRRVVPL